MRKRNTKATLATLFIILSLLMASIPQRPSTAQAQSNDADNPPVPAAVNRLFLPLVAQAGIPPVSDFVITSPDVGLTIAGTTIFAVQPVGASNIVSVTFRAGATALGSDDTPDDGFQVFLTASTLPAGPIELAATAASNRGQTATETISVTVVPNPPASAAVGPAGTTLGTPAGATLVIPPGALTGTQTVSIRERTQAEVTAETGIQWDELGVTFLGDIEVQGDVAFSRPPGVTTVGFANRIQPGQAVVTYQLLPDQDGDDISELVVVNTATAAPNGAIVSAPIPGLYITGVQTGTGTALAGPSLQDDSLRGRPGTSITIRGSGFNPASLRGNIASFRSLVNGEVLEMPGLVLPDPANPGMQLFRTVMPPLAPGAATLTLRNASTGETVGPLDVTIETPAPLSKPAPQMMDEFLRDSITYLQGVPTATPEDVAAKNQSIAGLTQSRSDLAQLVARGLTTEDAAILSRVALVIQNSDVYTVDARRTAAGILPAAYDADARIGDMLNMLWGAVSVLGGIAAVATATTAFVAFAGGAGIAIGLLITAYYACRLIRGGSCFGDPPSDPAGACSPAQGGASQRSAAASVAQAGGAPSFGIGGAPPPGGNGCGNAGGGGGGGQISLAQATPTSYVIKVFPRGGTGRPLSPFTGVTDPGGYFFLPFIPEGEPFTAVALDPARGVARTFDGVGPPTGQSVLMFFDFSGAEQSIYPIRIGDTVANGDPAPGAGNIELPGTTDTYTFTATAGQYVSLNMQQITTTLERLNVRLQNANGTRLLDERLEQGDAVNRVLVQSGTYTLTVGDTASDRTGTYQFQLVNLPADRFTITVGDVISDTLPGPGAGNIERPGARDIYVFTATPGQQVFVDTLTVAPEVGAINWRLVDADGIQFFDTCLGCGDQGVQTLTLGGTYAIIVGEDQDDSTGTYSFGLVNVPAPQVFPMAIGDVISDTIPGAGSGNIETPGVRDIYVFNATAGQQVFVDALTISPEMGAINWRLEDAVGTVLFDTCLGCGDPGVQTLTLGGTYTMTVGEDRDDRTGTYAFRLVNVPAPQLFPIAIGDTISDTVPGPGAGNIETPGVRDIYVFSATAGQQVFVDALTAAPEVGAINWRLEDAAGTVLFDTCLGCGDPGVQTLTLGGTYTMTVGEDRDDRTGTYSFRLVNVPAPQEFAIAIGDTISDTVPGPGAGNIETPGVRDIYTFSATAGQQIFVDSLTAAPEVGAINWRLEDAAGTVLFDTCLGCGEQGVQTLTRGGTYTITVGEDRDDRTGTYSFRLLNVPAPQEFAITIGDTISDGVPGPGAGNIESPGVRDIYMFSATAGQQVFVDALTAAPEVGSINWRLEDANDTVIFDTCLGCGDPGVQTLTLGGMYTITVGEDRDDRTGTYSFRLTTP